MTRIIIIAILAYLQMANSQYYSQPNTYQPYNYFQSAVPPLASMNTQPSLAPAYSSMYAPQPNLPSPYYGPSFVPTIASPVPYPSTFAMPSIAPPSPMYATPAAYSPYSPTPTIPPFSYSYPSPMVSSKPPPGPKTTQISIPTSKYAPATATAYYLTAQETPKAALVEKVKENFKDLAPPTYPCPFCTGFANVPKNSKVLPPPPCSAVLPGILDKIPTIALPDELKIKDLCKLAKPCPLLSDLFEHKLSGKLKFDEDLLDGFLTGLGLGK